MVVKNYHLFKQISEISHILYPKMSLLAPYVVHALEKYIYFHETNRKWYFLYIYMINRLLIFNFVTQGILKSVYLKSLI